MTAFRKSSLVKVPKASDLVAGDLRRRIVTGELAIGEFLPSEASLLQEFGVSRPTLREAFRILESEAIITVRRGARGGVKVTQPNDVVAARHLGILLQYEGVALADVYDARTEIELSAVGMIIANKRKSAIRDLDKLVRGGAAVLALEDDIAFGKYANQLHQTLVEASGCATLATLARLLFQIFDAHNVAFVAAHPEGVEPSINQTVVRAFARLVELLTSGDTAAAQRHWRKHLVAVERYMVGDSDATVVEILS